jgi:hypothetical protein
MNAVVYIFPLERHMNQSILVSFDNSMNAFPLGSTRPQSFNRPKSFHKKITDSSFDGSIPYSSIIIIIEI